MHHSTVINLFEDHTVNIIGTFAIDLYQEMHHIMTFYLSKTMQ